MQPLRIKFGPVLVGAATLAFGLAGTATATAAPADSAGAPGCAQGCTEKFAYDLGDGTVLTGLDKQSGPGAYVTVRHNGRVTSSTRVDEVTPGSIDYLERGSCSPRAGNASCIVTGGTGAHSESAIVFTVDVHSAATKIGSSVLHGAPGAQIADLNRDGTPDVAMRESTYEPDYASAPQYWVSYVNRGGKLVRTGCTAPSTESQPTPSSPLTGKCYA